MKKRPNNDGSINRYKDGWRGQYTDPISHKQRAVYGKTQAECKAKLDRKLSEIRAGEYTLPEKITVGAWMAFWFENYYRISVKASSAATTSDNIRLHIVPALGSIQLQKLRPEDIQAFLRAEQEAGRAPSTVRRYLKVLRQAIKQAIDTGKMRKDPSQAVKLPKMEKPDIPFLTMAEQAAVLRALPQSTSGRALRFLLGTGMRVSELCGLQWKDVQADGIHIERINMTIHDLKEDGYINMTTAPKTTAGKRIIPLPAALASLLDDQRRAQMQERLRAGEAWAGGEAGKGETFIFANALGKPSDRHNLNRAFRGVLDRCGLDRRGVHSLRHTFATNWVQHSPDIPALARVLGHTDPAFTYKTYCHADQASMAQGMDMMANILQQAK